MKRAALFVGTDYYEDNSINNLTCAQSDAADLHGFFKHKAGFNEVHRLFGPDPEAIMEAASSMMKGLSTGDLFLFFFAGHGVEYELSYIYSCYLGVFPLLS